MAIKLRPSTKQKTYKSLGIKSTNPTVQANIDFNRKLAAIRKKLVAKLRRRHKRRHPERPFFCTAALRINYGQYGIEPPPVKVVPYPNNNN